MRLIGINNMNASKRSPFTLDTYEVAVAIIACFATSLILYLILKNTPPYYSENIPVGWENNRWLTLFATYVIPMALFMAVSSVSLLRAMRKEEIHYLSRLTNIAIAIPPLLSFLPLNLLSFFSLYCLFFGFIFFVAIGFLIVIQGFDNSEITLGGWFALLWNIVWIVFAYYYFDSWWARFGD